MFRCCQDGSGFCSAFPLFRCCHCPIRLHVDRRCLGCAFLSVFFSSFLLRCEIRPQPVEAQLNPVRSHALTSLSYSLRRSDYRGSESVYTYYMNVRACLSLFAHCLVQICDRCHNSNCGNQWSIIQMSDSFMQVCVAVALSLHALTSLLRLALARIHARLARPGL